MRVDADVLDAFKATGPGGKPASMPSARCRQAWPSEALNPRGRFTFKRPSTQRPTSPGQPLARQAMAAPGAFWWPALGRVRATVRLIQPGALPRSAAVLVLFAINEIAACACLAWPRGRFAFKRCSTQSSANPGQPLARRAMTAPGAFWWPALGRVRAARAAGQLLAGCVPPCARSTARRWWPGLCATRGCRAAWAVLVLLPAVLVLLRVLVASTWPGCA